MYICKEIKCYTDVVYPFYYHVDLGPSTLIEVNYSHSGSVKFRSASSKLTRTYFIGSI